MSDTPPDEKKSAEAPTTNSMAAFSNQLDNLTESLDLLYIPYNASGRNKFREKLPSIAQYIFGSQLVKYDDEGTSDIDHRIKLEEEANERRLELKITISEIIDKSVDQGTLIFDYVGQVIDRYGAEVSQFLYADEIIERVRPGLLATITSETKTDDNDEKGDEAATNSVEPEKQQEQKLSEEEASILSNPPEEEALIEETPLEETQPESLETKEATMEEVKTEIEPPPPIPPTEEQKPSAPSNEPEEKIIPPVKIEPKAATEEISYTKLFNSVAIGK